MKKFTEEQIAYALRQVEGGSPAADVCRAAGSQRSDLLHLEEEVRSPGRQRAAEAAIAQGRKQPAQTVGRGPHARQAHARGGVEHIALHRGPTPLPIGPTERWSMDFVHNALADGRPFRVLTVVDQWSRQTSGFTDR